MDLLLNLLDAVPPVGRVLLILGLIAVLGLSLGQVKLKGVGLGIGGVLFAGIAVGHLASRAGIHLDHAMLEFVREFGLILFVYSIGIQVGPGFFAALKRAGLGLNLMAASLVLLGALVAVAIHLLADLPLPVVLGLFSGAVTNTPSLGAAQQALQQTGADPSLLALPPLGYAIAYPFGIAGILLTMALIRGLFRVDVAASAAAYEAKRRATLDPIATLDVVVRRPELDGMLLCRLPGLGEGVVASRLLRHGVLQVPHDGTRVEPGDVLHLVGPPDRLARARDALGTAYDMPLTTKGTDLAWARVVVTETRVLGKTISALNLEDTHDVRVSRVTRSGVELVVTPGLHLQFGDILNIIGKPDDIRRAGALLGSEHRLKEVHLSPMFIGIVLGLILGSLPLMLPGMPAPLKLGLAGGPLVAALILARVGRIGRFVWFMPPVANTALRELGIVLFLAVVGFRSGGQFVETLLHGGGAMWLLYGALITLLPLLLVGFFAHLVMKTNYLTTCGLLAGSMTDPPALAFANSLSPSEAPALAYATVYPLVMCLRILVPQIMVIALM